MDGIGARRRRRGNTFLTTPWVLWTWIPVAPNYAVLQYFPFILYLASEPVTGARAAILLGAPCCRVL
jgi:hypothetical protein